MAKRQRRAGMRKSLRLILQVIDGQLDRERYEALKTMGLKLDKKSQQILVEALDAWLLAHHGSK